MAVPAEGEPQARGVVPALGVIPDDERVVADAEAGHGGGEVGRRLEHVRRVTGRGWGSRDVAPPVAVDGAGEMAAQVIGARVALEPEPAVDDPHAGISEPRGDVVGRDEQLRARECAHRDNLTVLRGNLRRGLALARWLGDVADRAALS